MDGDYQKKRTIANTWETETNDPKHKLIKTTTARTIQLKPDP